MVFDLNGEEVKKASFGAAFHGETWYKCPWCNDAFEFWDTKFDRGFEKTENSKIYRHKKCGKLIDMT